MAGFLLVFVFGKRPQQGTAREWGSLIVRSVFAVVTLAAYWKVLCAACAHAWWHGLIGMLFWPYLLAHGLVYMHGWQRLYPFFLALLWVALWFLYKGIP